VALIISEVFGYHPSDRSAGAKAQRKSELCPFTKKTCKKKFRSDGVIHGTCTVQPPGEPEVICCPNRLYAEDYKILHDVAYEVYGDDVQLIRPSDIAATQGALKRVVAFGTGWGGELKVPKGDGSKGGGFSADWTLALINKSAELLEFVPLEVQSIDTTGSYQSEWCRVMGHPPPRDEGHDPNMNWENVNKRIIPQLLTKGNVFRREKLCKKGLFFVCPTPVYENMLERLGAELQDYSFQAGALTFRTYALKESTTPGKIRPLVFQKQFTTTVDHLRDIFNSTLSLPPKDVMGTKIQRLITDALKKANQTKLKGA
jgi:hypothetical protein